MSRFATRMLPAIAAIAAIFVLLGQQVRSEETRSPPPRPKRLLLLGQKPDSHPKATHEYMAGCRLIATHLQNQNTVQVVVVQADNPWVDGPELIDGADAVLLFLSEGAKWISADPQRLAAFKRLAERGGGFSCLHWGMGTKESPPIAEFVSLFGGCHGGPDRKYRYTDYHVVPASVSHPTLRGVQAFDVHDEFYYDLKFASPRERVTPLLATEVDGVDYVVSWAVQRPDGGHSFGFSGLHFHENWKRLEYRRLILQGVLWTLKESIPESGVEVDLVEGDFALPERPAGK